jgi:hypothetical protein
MRLWPSRYPLKGKETLYEFLAPLLKADMEADPALREPRFGSTLGGAPTDPARFDEADLMERETEWGQAGFQLQFMLDTSLTDQNKFPLKTQDLIVMDVDPERAPIHVACGRSPKQMLRELDNVGFDGDRFYGPMTVSEEWTPYAGSMMEIDPSGSGTDETAYAVTRFLAGRIWLSRWGGYLDGHSEETLRALAEIAVDERVPLVRVEGNFGDGMFARLLETELRRAGYKGAVEVHKVHGAKEGRIIGHLQPVLRNHRLVVDTNVVKEDLEILTKAGSKVGKFALLEYSGLYQLTHLANQRGSIRKDDRIDVLSNAAAYWLEHMALDSQKAEADEKRKQDEDFARLVAATQISGTGSFLPEDPPGRRRGAPRVTSSRSPGALRRAFKRRSSATWR